MSACTTDINHQFREGKTCDWLRRSSWHESSQYSRNFGITAVCADLQVWLSLTAGEGSRFGHLADHFNTENNRGAVHLSTQCQ